MDKNKFDVFNSFAGKLITRILVDIYDRVFVIIGRWGTDNYAPYEHVYCGQWQDRPWKFIMGIQNEICREVYPKWTEVALAKRPYLAQDIKYKIQNKMEAKARSLIVSEESIKTFLYYDQMFLSKRLMFPLETFIPYTAREKADLEKYPAGFARYIVEKVEYLYSKVTYNTQYNWGPKDKKVKQMRWVGMERREVEYVSRTETSERINPINRSYLFNAVIKHAPRRVKKCKWVVAQKLLDKKTAERIDLSSKWNFYSSLMSENVRIKPEWVKAVASINHTVKPRSLKGYASTVMYIRDYSEWAVRQGVILPANINVDFVRNAVEWHNDRFATKPKDPNQPMPINPKHIPELEEFRIKTAGEMVALGEECRHCLGTKFKSSNMFYVKIKDDKRSSVVCAEVDLDKGMLVQCFDKNNRTTKESKEFEDMLRKTYNLTDYTYSWYEAPHAEAILHEVEPRDPEPDAII